MISVPIAIALLGITVQQLGMDQLFVPLVGIVALGEMPLIG
jgi:hypothetical protein